MARNYFKISEFSTLNFHADWKLPFQYDVSYVQRFLPTDILRIQFTVSSDSLVKNWLYDGHSRKSILPTQVDDNIYELVYSNLKVGSYVMYFELTNTGQIIASSQFCVCEQLEDTLLFAYTNRSNTFDTIFQDRVFGYRVEGVSLPGEVAFHADSEGFRDQRNDYTQLSCFPYSTEIITLGGGRSALGVPNWVARKINDIFSLSNVLVDGRTVVRSEGSTPEPTEIAGSYPLFLYKIIVEYGNDYGFDAGLPDYWLLAAEDGRLIATEDGNFIDLSPN